MTLTQTGNETLHGTEPIAGPNDEERDHVVVPIERRWRAPRHRSASSLGLGTRLVNTKPQTIKDVCHALLEGDRTRAAEIARRHYPFTPIESVTRKYSHAQATRLFVRDGFIDRYLGSRLVFPGTLRILSRVLPEEFPAHAHWKMSKSHIMYWELFPTLDHVVPIARGGADDESNLVTTSMLRNSAKSNWTLEELGWHLLPPGDFAEWDGLMHWFLAFTKSDASHLSDAFTRAWHAAAARVLART